MKIPENPPTFEKLSEEIKNSKIDFLQLLATKLDDDKYFSYDDTKYRPIPDAIKNLGGDRNAWWFRIQIDRMAKFQTLPFQSANKNCFKFFTDSADMQIMHNMDLNGGGTLGVSESFPNENERNKYFISSLIEEAFYSSYIEGAVSTREIAKKMIAENREPKDKNERMILNNYITMHLLESWKDETLSPELICRIHSHISKDTLEDEKLGRYRTQEDNDVVLADDEGNIYHTPCQHTEIANKIDELCNFANTTTKGQNFMHPIIKGIILHFMLAYIHPFCDGNGRTARAIFYWYILKNNYWIAKFISISKIIMESGNRYYKSFLDTESDSNDLNYFIKFQLEVLDRAIKSFLDFLSIRRKEISAATENSEILKDLNDRQKSIVLKIIRKPYENLEFTIESHRGLNAISWETSRKDLLTLEKRKILSKRKSGNAFIFSPAKNFLEGLKS